MRKDKLTSFQAKKQKLLKIKDIIIETRCEEIKFYGMAIYEKTPLSKIWELVKDE